jgi:hypothetical protein
MAISSKPTSGPESRLTTRFGGSRAVVDQVLRGMDAHFDEMYAEGGRPSIPPERLLKAKVLQAP